MAAPMKRVEMAGGEDGHSVVPAKQSRLETSGNALEKFLRWCEGHKFSLSPKVLTVRLCVCVVVVPVMF